MKKTSLEDYRLKEMYDKTNKKAMVDYILKTQLTGYYLIKYYNDNNPNNCIYVCDDLEEIKYIVDNESLGWTINYIRERGLLTLIDLKERVVLDWYELLYQKNDKRKGILNKIINDIKADAVIGKHIYKHTWLSGSSTLVHPITLWEKEIVIQLDNDRNIYNKAIQRIIKKHKDILTGGLYYKSDGSCPNTLTFYYDKNKIY